MINVTDPLHFNAIMYNILFLQPFTKLKFYLIEMQVIHAGKVKLIEVDYSKTCNSFLKLKYKLAKSKEEIPGRFPITLIASYSNRIVSQY